VEKDGTVSASVCQPHDCSDHSLAVAFDHTGHVWASLVKDGKPTYFGNPDETIGARLQP
jgi:hypothetical protein